MESLPIHLCSQSGVENTFLIDLLAVKRITASVFDLVAAFGQAPEKETQLIFIEAPEEQSNCGSART